MKYLNFITYKGLKRLWFLKDVSSRETSILCPSPPVIFHKQDLPPGVKGLHAKFQVTLHAKMAMPDLQRYNDQA